nr:basic salivary proline-rich protein 4-like [Vulpes vulpes]
MGVPLRRKDASGPGAASPSRSPPGREGRADGERGADAGPTPQAEQAARNHSAAPGQPRPPRTRSSAGSGSPRLPGRGDALRPRRTLSAPLRPACARALAPSPAEFNTMPTPTPCATPRLAQQLRRRGRGVVRQGEGKSARESRRQRETRGGRKRACAPPPASGEAEPQQRRKDYAPGGPASQGSSAGRSPAAAARDALRGGGEKGGTGNGERNADRPPPLPPSFPPSLPPIRRPPSRLPSPPPPAKPRMEPPPTRRRLAPGDGFVRRPEPRRQAQPPPPPRGAPALASQNWVPVWSGPSACLHPEPRDRGRSSSLLPPLVPEPFASSGGPRPPSAFPEPGLGAARGHRPREVEALRAYLSPVLLRRGTLTVNFQV